MKTVFLLLNIYILSYTTGCNNNKPIELQATLLVNHIAYGQNGFKKLVLQTNTLETPGNFQIIDSKNKTVFKSSFEKGGQIDSWNTGKAYEGIFSDVKQNGEYFAQCSLGGKIIKSEIFTIAQNELSNKCLPLLIDGFKSQRCAAPYDTKDKQMSFFGKRDDIVDVHGGWYDASGEKGKYFSHLCFSNYMNPQQTPMVVWNMLESAQQYESSADQEKTGLQNRMIKEAIYGADFLVRMQDPKGYFYTIVFANWSGEAKEREICCYEGHKGKRSTDYQAAFREGGGMAIAALARISTTGKSGDYKPQDYLAVAIKGFDHLLKNNIRYVDDGKENIIDNYCALLAATELFAATKKDIYLNHAQRYMKQLVSFLHSNKDYNSWWSADTEGTRPYFHAAEAGLPLIALYRYLQFETNSEFKDIAIGAIQKSVAHELLITNEINNPFGYARQYVKSPGSKKHASFFIPHKNETGYWWQGENARISSLASAFQLVMPYLEKNQQKGAKKYATDQINWVLGLNPYNTCMLDGAGQNNPDYKEEGRSLNYKGGVCNGITAGFNNESDIAFMPLPQNNNLNHRWRWSEQWLIHPSWFMLAIASSGL